MTEREQDLLGSANYLEHCKEEAIKLSILLSEAEIIFPYEAKAN